MIKILGIFMIVSMCFAQAVSAVEIWSDPGTTEVWSDPGNTEIWSEPTETEIWSDVTETEQWTEIIFTESPRVVNKRTLVPMRETMEQLGYVVEWNQSQKQATIKKGNSIITLGINATTANINGKAVSLDVPAHVFEQKIYVPLRFISEATGSEVGWDQATTKVTIDNKFFFYLDSSKKENPTNGGSSNFYVGKWDIWVPGGYGTTGQTTNPDGSVTKEQEYIPGASGKSLTIHSNGTYTWQVVGETIKGNWSSLTDGRILLSQGQYGDDWYVERVEQNQIKIYAWGLEEHGYRMK